MPTLDGNNISFLIAGQRDSTRRDGISANTDPLPVGLTGKVKDSIKVGAGRASGNVRIDATIGEDVVVVYIVDGPELILHPEHARDLFNAQTGGSRRAAADHSGYAVEVPVRLGWRNLEGTATETSRSARGLVSDVIIKTIKIVSGILTDKLEAYVSDELVGRIDGQVIEGVYKLQSNSMQHLKGKPIVSSFPEQKVTSERVDKPVLVFIHGTFSNTASSFGKLWTQFPDRVNELFAHYGDEVYALDHRTLSVSPIDNAITLVNACEPGSRLHLVTHSRGGLVAEALARAAALSSPDEAIKHFNQPGYEPQFNSIKTLISLLEQKQIRIERVVRVACPARGTLLASKRLDAYLSVLRWALNLSNIPVLPDLVEFIGAVAARRLQPDQMPGLDAMVPDTPLIQWLHAAEEPIAGELRVVAGDLEGDSVCSWLKTLVADAYYWTDNDLVVHTSSMYGGVTRLGSNASRFVLDTGGKVSHFSYFANEKTAMAIVDALVQNNPSNYQPIGPLSYAGKSADGLRGAAKDADPSKPAIFVIPGILGSHIALNDKRIWLSWRWLFGLKNLAYPEPDGCKIRPDGAIGSSYDELQEFLAQSHDVHEFSFDWRLPIKKEGRRLAEEIKTALDLRKNTNQPVRIIAHSMGGIVVRALQLAAPAVWDRLLLHEQARILFLGTPHGGSWVPMQILTGDDTLGNTLTSVGSSLQGHEAREIIAQFPGLLQLQAGLFGHEPDLGKVDIWKQLAKGDQAAAERHRGWHHNDDVDSTHSFYRWGIPRQAVLDQAVTFRRELEVQAKTFSKAHLSKMFNVLGKADSTPDGIYLNKKQEVFYVDVDTGDGRVTGQNALLPGVTTWQTDCNHSDLTDYTDAFAAYLDILKCGETDLLSPVTLDTLRSGDQALSTTIRCNRPSRQAMTRVLPAREHFSDQHNRDHANLNNDRAPALEVTVENADITFVSDALLLGHYRASTLHGTEWVANKLINGTMKESLALGQYPDRPGSNRIFANLGVNHNNPMQAARPDCVIVAGLGEEGALSSAELTFTVKMGVLARAQQHFESAHDTQAEFKIASTLLASGGYGISAGLSAQHIIKGVLDANRAIRDINSKFNEDYPDRRWPTVSHLRLVELYSSRATEAWMALNDLRKEFSADIIVTPFVKMGHGAMKRLNQHGYRGIGSDILSAIAEDNSRILYTVATRRARSEVRAQSTQVRLVKRLVESASDDRNQDQKISRTLFQLLMPEEARTIVNGSSELQLELNSGTAGIPWELLDSRNPPETRRRTDDPKTLPWAIRCKLIRKLRLENFRHNVIDAHREASILIIGEPKCDEDKYPRLTGARNEANAIQHALSESGVLGQSKIQSLISDEGRNAYQPSEVEVLNALMGSDWRIIHVAGHGEPPAKVDRNDPNYLSLMNRGEHGVVLAGGTFLGPNEIGTMSVVPELVFMNCCHLAASDSNQLLLTVKSHSYDRAEFAAGIAQDLIKIGVKCVIAAGWAVEDNQAQIFATTFYKQLISGQRFTDAVAVARKAAYFEGGNTWAAYQCYGDPDWTLTSTQRTMNKGKDQYDEYEDIGSPESLIIELANIGTQSQFQNAKAGDQFECLNELFRRFGSRWSDMGEVAEAFADAWAASGGIESAIEWYAKARTAPDGRGTTKATERLANLRVRQAWAEVNNLSKVIPENTRKAKVAHRKRLIVCAKNANETINKSLRLIGQLLEVNETIERHALCGSAYKRLAMIARIAGTQAQATKALHQMAISYEHAERISQASEDANTHTYALHNMLCAQYVGGAYSNSWAGLNSVNLQQLYCRFTLRSAADPDFWSEVGMIEIDLLSILDQSVATMDPLSVDDFLSGIEIIKIKLDELYTRVQSRVQWSSVVDQMIFLTQDYDKRVNDVQKSDAVDTVMAKILGYSEC